MMMAVWIWMSCSRPPKRSSTAGSGQVRQRLRRQSSLRLPFIGVGLFSERDAHDGPAWLVTWTSTFLHTTTHVVWA